VACVYVACVYVACVSVMDKFRVGVDQINLTGRQELIFYSGKHRGDDLFRGTDDGKAKQCSLPEVLMSHLCAAGRKAISTASQQFLNHAAFLLEALRSIQAQIQLQYTDDHIKHAKGLFWSL
jgi:hypothetical protein